MSYAEYHQWLFPGDPLVEPNPLAADASAPEILDEVSCQTGVSVAWLQRSVREVLDGLAGLGCLWFLHGARGQVKGATKTPRWLGPIANFISQSILQDPEEQRRGIVGAYVNEENWSKGTITFEKGYKSRKPVVQNFKVGRFIDGFAEYLGLSDADRKGMHHDLKWRSKAELYDFVVSCSPYDVLTMSHGRAWPSCMKPGGLFEYGPLTDMAAGSAIVWFYRPEADEPCGRIILRPFLDEATGYEPAIATGGRLYGSGPDTSTDALNEMLAPWLQGIPIDRVNICPRGRDGLALTRAIYSDTDRSSEGCQQDRDEYEMAYDSLGGANWPAPQFDLGEFAEAAEKQAEGYEYRGMGEGEEDDWEDIAREEQLAEANRLLLQSGTDNIVNWYLVPGAAGAGPGVPGVYKAVSEPDALRGAVEDYVTDLVIDNTGDYCAFSEFGEEPDPEIYDDLYDVLWNGLVAHLNSETEELAGITTTAEQTAPFQRAILETGYPDLVKSYVPGDLISGHEHGEPWPRWPLEHGFFDALNIGTKEDAPGVYYDFAYPEDEMTEVVDRVFLMPEWFLEGVLAKRDDVNDATLLHVGWGIERGVAKELAPDATDWLDELLRRVG